MDENVRFAMTLIQEADTGKRLDAVMRERFKASRVPRNKSGEISALVLAYYRWKGWLNPGWTPRRQIEHAAELDRHFQATPDSFTTEELRRAVPAWVAEEMDLSRGLLCAFQSRPALWLRARPGQGAQLATQLGHCRRGEGVLDDALLYEGPQDLFRTPQFQAGEFEIQDVASQLVAFLCDPQPGETWWDACAGEGGKTLHFSDLMQNKGMIWATDRAEWRLQKLRQRAARARVFNYRTAHWDGGAKLPTKTRFHGVLIDAPCSGVGTWQKNPQARWTTTPKDVRELSELQVGLLRNAAAAVRPGGKLIYAVCSLTRSETDAVADLCSPRLPEFEPLPLPALPSAPPAASARRWIWPQQFGGNGMFVAAWRRLSSVPPAN